MADLLFRAHTWDENIWKSIVDKNEYGLPDKFSADDVVIDIGAHIGAFAYACLDRGAGKVICVEPDPENFLYLRHNLHFVCRSTDRAICISAACWRSDRVVRHIHYAPVGANTGGGNTLGSDGMPVAALSLDSLTGLAMSLSPSGTIRLVKMDCEGAEFASLYTASKKTFDCVDAFIGEYHTLNPEQFPEMDLKRPCTPEELNKLFVEKDYRFTSKPSANGLGLFRAWKPWREV